MSAATGARRHSLSAAENEALRKRVRALRTRFTSQNAAARALGVTGSHLSLFLSGKVGASPMLAGEVARFEASEGLADAPPRVSPATLEPVLEQLRKEVANPGPRPVYWHHESDGFNVLSKGLDGFNVLSEDLDDAITYALDDHDGPLPATVTMVGLSPRPYDTELRRLIEASRERLVEFIDEVVGDPEERFDLSPLAAIAWEVFAQAVTRDFESLWVDEIERQEVDVAEWVKANAPEWADRVEPDGVALAELHDRRP